MKIRGFGSALVVVDGIPGRNYSDIDPSEIESVSVLKDASAAAVYGMQGANGVILVTTKRGGKNKPTTLDINTRFGLQMPHNYPQPASTPLWQTLVGEYYANMKLINDKNAVITPADMATRDYAYNTNWYEEMIKNAPITQSISIFREAQIKSVILFQPAIYIVEVFGQQILLIRIVSISVVIWMRIY